MLSETLAKLRQLSKTLRREHLLPLADQRHLTPNTQSDETQPQSNLPNFPTSRVAYKPYRKTKQAKPESEPTV